MKKIIIAAIAALAMAVVVPVGGASAATDLEDGQECASGGDGARFLIPGAQTDEQDRGYGCVSAGGTAVAYVGGEGQSEGEPGTGGACGAVIVGGQTVTGDADWEKPDNPDTADEDESTDCD